MTANVETWKEEIATSAYESTLAWLYRLEVTGGIDLKLERMRQAAAALGHPQRCAPAFHIGGTNGKGSTAAMLAAMLTASGRRVGLYTSPHLVSFCERIAIDGVPITHDEVVEGVARIRRSLGNRFVLTYFEVVTLLAWCIFAARRVDVQVLEVGLGGRLDATNLVFPEVAIITNVDRDHEEFLGHDIAAIAAEKSGIIKPRVPVVSGATSVGAAVVAAQAAALASPLHQLGRDFRLAPDGKGALAYSSPATAIAPLELALMGAHQRQNAALAIRALEVTPSFTPTEMAVRAGLAGVRWAGRLQVVRAEPLVVLDGAHNPAAVDVVVDEVRRLAAGRPVRVLFGVMRDKAWQAMLRSLGALASEIVLTRPRQARSADPVEMAVAAPVSVCVSPDPVDAYHQVVNTSAAGDVVLVTGSLFLIGDLLPAVAPDLAREAEREHVAARLAGR